MGERVPGAGPAARAGRGRQGAAGRGRADPDRLRRFDQEARAVAALNHPNILTVFDVGAHVAAGETAVGAAAAAIPYVVVELLQGETLRELASRRAPTQRQVLGWAVQAAQGVEAAHAKGIVHRDLKPENVFVTTEGRVKILDFGLAKQADRLTAESAETTASSPTDAGQVVGTVGYMSPEQVRGLAVDPRTDVFSFGVLLYELLGGRHPFRRETTIATLTAILEERPAELSTLGRGITPAVSGIVRRCLEKGREERYGSAHDVRVALEAVLAAPAGSAVLQEVEERSPYPGLTSFTEKDSVFFFGREQEAKALWERLRARPLWGVIGPSGAGKTSFVRAGIVASRPEGWAAIVCTPGAAPFRGLGQALVPELAGDVEAMQRLLSVDDPAVAFDLVSRWRKGHAEALLVVDQFEELFTLNPSEVQERFAGLLGRLVREADVHVLLSFRDDFLMRCADHEPLARVFESLTPLPALSAEGLGRALVEPAKARGYRFEDDALVGEMVTSVEGARSALPLLAFAVSRLWEKRDREKKVLTRAGYEEIGGVAGALAQHAEATLDRIGSTREPIVREIFRTLVTSQGTRSVAEREEVLSLFPERKAVEEVLGELIDTRLLTSYEVDGAEGQSRHRVEIVHESLLRAWPRLVRWQAQDEEGALLRDQLKQAAHLWEEKGRTCGSPVDGDGVPGVRAVAGPVPGCAHRARRGLRDGHGREGAPAEAPAHRRGRLGDRGARRPRDRDRRLAPAGRAGARPRTGGGAARRVGQALRGRAAPARRRPDGGAGLRDREPGARRHEAGPRVRREGPVGVPSRPRARHPELRARLQPRRTPPRPGRPLRDGGGLEGRRDARSPAGRPRGAGVAPRRRMGFERPAHYRAGLRGHGTARPRVVDPGRPPRPDPRPRRPGLLPGARRAARVPGPEGPGRPVAGGGPTPVLAVARR